MNNNRTKLKSQLFYTGLFLYCVPTILQTTLLVETSYWNELFVYLRYIAFYFGIVLIADEHIAFKDGKWFHPYLTDIRRDEFSKFFFFWDLLQKENWPDALTI